MSTPIKNNTICFANIYILDAEHRAINILINNDVCFYFLYLCVR